MQINRLTINCEGNAAANTLFTAISQLIGQIPELNSLINRATRGGPITVNFVPPNSTPTGATWSAGDRSISIESDEGTFYTLHYLIFELCNAANDYFQSSGNNIRPDQHANRDEYAYATELGEYMNTYIPARTVTDSIINNNPLMAQLRSRGIVLNPRDIQGYRGGYMADFDAWWRNANIHKPGNACSHAEFYRRQYDRVMQERAQWHQRHQQHRNPQVAHQPQRCHSQHNHGHASPINNRIQNPHPRQSNIDMTFNTVDELVAYVTANNLNLRDFEITADNSLELEEVMARMSNIVPQFDRIQRSTNRPHHQVPLHNNNNNNNQDHGNSRHQQVPAPNGQSSSNDAARARQLQEDADLAAALQASMGMF